MRLDPGICVFAAGQEILGWALNHRDSQVAGLTPLTETAVFLGEAVSTVHMEGLACAAAEIVSVFKLAGADVSKIACADRYAPDVALTV